MMIKRDHRCSWWPYLVSFLLLGALGSVLFGGFNQMLEYRKSMEPGILMDEKNLRFFTKDYIQRIYQKWSADKLPEITTLPSFYLYTDENNIVSLDSDLPASGKSQFKQGYIRTDKPELTSEVQFRYRGGLPLHWLFKKKSLRIKLPPYTTYNGDRQFNLVNPSTIYTVTDWISYEMARSVGLLAPDYFPARVFINNRSNGLHFYLSRIDESLLRKNKRMPGSIYSGDTIYVPNPFGADPDGRVEMTFSDQHGGLSYMWQDDRLWEKSASRNAESEHDREDIKHFLDIVNQHDPVIFMQEFERYFETQKYNLFWALDMLVGSFHHDLFHNHKMYFDPYKGKFEPIEWDVRFWSSMMPIPEYPLLRRIKLNPLLDHEYNLALYKLWNRFPVKEVSTRIDHMSKQLLPEIAADPYRQQPDSFNNQFFIDKVVPYSVEEYTDAIEDLKLTYNKRHKFVKDILEDSSVRLRIKPLAHDEIDFSLEVDGNSAVHIDVWSVIPDALTAQVKVVRILENKNNISEVKPGVIELLYPGKSIQPGNKLGLADVLTQTAIGKDRLEPSPLHYQYRLEGISLNELQLGMFSAVNAVTGTRKTIEIQEELSDTTETQSVHPWFISSNRQDPSGPVQLSGIVHVDEDHIYSEGQQVTILPGTVFKLAKNRSLFFYGKVMATGTASQPIRFEQKIPGEAWGSLVIQGKSASGSELKYIQVSGGSLTTHQLIDYPGELNIHDVENFKLEHCVIKDNSVGDDALHIAYSQGEISHCRFENTAFDALDMDIVQVMVSNSEFNDAGNDALDLMTSTVMVKNIKINGAGDKCFSVGEGSDVQILQSQLNNCQTGIAVKDESTAYIEDIRFGHFRQAAIAMYRKNPRYAKGGSIKGQRLFGITGQDVTVGESSRSDLTLENVLPGAH